MVKIKTISDLQKYLMEKYHVNLYFISLAVSDYKSINKGSRPLILKLIIRRVKEGPLFVPDGVAQSLHGKLHGYAKIKPKALNLRIIYRPIRHDDYVTMEIIAIGPRDHDKVYKVAAERLN